MERKGDDAEKHRAFCDSWQRGSPYAPRKAASVLGPAGGIAGDATGIVTSGLEYPLRNETLSFGPARGMSNVLTEREAHIKFATGLLLVIYTIGRA